MRFQNAREASDFLFREVRGPIRLGTPLGLGKPNVFLNHIFERVRAEPERELEIYTALSLDVAIPPAFLARRFLGPFLERHLGADYPWLRFVRERDHLPPNVRVFEFYSQAGTILGSAKAQQNHISLNYTYAARSLLDRGLNCVVQLVARGADGRLSLSCNPDITRDLTDLARARGQRLVKIACVHEGLPFLEGDAVVREDFFDGVLDGGENYALFALPRLAVSEAEHAIGLHASSLVADGGTIQIGIGALADTLCSALRLRHQQNGVYQAVLRALDSASPRAEREPFREGLFGLSEMVMDGLLRLRQEGILKRVVAVEGGRPAYLQGGFFLGSRWLYETLRELSPEERRGILMSRISKVNDLYDPHETEVRRERPRARFFNTTMEVNLLGGAVSETLANGAVVSGVGGQYNFVAMAHELRDAISVLLLHSTRKKGGRRTSNLTFRGGHLTIPRHLRDTVVTEYGIAHLRGRTDEECVRALIEIADAEFQPGLVVAAQRAGKLARDYEIPERALGNTPANLARRLNAARAAGALPRFPFGSDFTPEEGRIFVALQALEEMGPAELVRTFVRGCAQRGFAAELSRLGLDSGGWRERLFRPVLRGALASRP